MALLQDELDEASVFICRGVDVAGVGQHRGQAAVRPDARRVDRHGRPEKRERRDAVSRPAQKGRTLTQRVDLSPACDLSRARRRVRDVCYRHEHPTASIRNHAPRRLSVRVSHPQIEGALTSY